MTDTEDNMSEDTPLLSGSYHTPTTEEGPGHLVRSVRSGTTSPGTGLIPFGENDDNLSIFRRAIGINSDIAYPITPDIETGRKNAVGMYRVVIQQQQRKKRIHHAVSALVWSCHGVQIIAGAALTSLGLSTRPGGGSGGGDGGTKIAITVLGAVQTIVASLLTTLRSKGLPEKLAKPEAEFRELQGWIEETEALIAVGVAGRNREEVGELVGAAFQKYNACFGKSIALEGEIDRSVVSSVIYNGKRASQNDGGAVRLPN